jgi:hypothetical protein
MRAKAKRLVAGFCAAAAMAGALVIMGPGVDWCEADWVKESAFWRWYFNCDGGNNLPQ